MTGATGGIGASVALAFSDCGARVALLSRRENQLDRLAHEIVSHGGVALPVRCDVADEHQVETAVRRVEAELGAVDILINAAGIAIPEWAANARIEDLRRMMDVNYFGTVHTVRSVLPAMLNAGRGNIVNIGSIAGRQGYPTLSAYCGSKFAVTGFSEALRIELNGTGVTVSLVMPGPVDTPMLDNPHWQARNKNQLLKIFMVPMDWIVWGVLAAVSYGLAEVDVPLGTGVLNKLAAIFPDISSAWYSFGTRIFDLFNEVIDPFD